MSRFISRCVVGVMVGLAASGNALAADADDALGRLPCIQDEHRFALAADAVLWQLDNLVAICIDKFDDQETSLLEAKKAFNRAIEPQRQKTYSTVAYGVFHPHAGDQAPKARELYLTTLTTERLDELKESATASDCQGLTESLTIYTSESKRDSFGPTLEGIIRPVETDTRGAIPSCQQ